MNSVVNTWASQEPAAAGQWISKLRDETVRDNAYESYVNSTSRNFPEYAATCATAITDQKKRENAIYNTASNWIRADSTAALAWLATTDLPDNRKQELEKRVK